MPVIRGSYRGTYNGLNIGNTEIGFRLSYAYNGRNINFDAIGETPADIIYAGMSMSVDFVAQEYDSAAIDDLRWPFFGIPGQVAPAGLSMWDLARPLLLTSCLSGTDPRTILFPKAILAPGFSLDVDFSHRERPLPMRLMVLPVKYLETGYAASVDDDLYRPDGCAELIYFVETLWP